MNIKQFLFGKIEKIAVKSVSNSYNQLQIDLDELTTLFAASTSHRDDDNESVMSFSLSRKNKAAEVGLFS